MISGRKHCAQLLNMNQTVSLVGRSDKIIYMNYSAARCFYWKAVTKLAQRAEVVCVAHDGRSRRTAPKTFSSSRTLHQLSTTTPRKSPINTVSVSLWLSLRKSMTSPFRALFSAPSLVSFLKPDWNRSKCWLSPSLVPL